MKRTALIGSKKHQSNNSGTHLFGVEEVMYLGIKDGLDSPDILNKLVTESQSISHELLHVVAWGAVPIFKHLSSKFGKEDAMLHCVSREQELLK